MLSVVVSAKDLSHVLSEQLQSAVQDVQLLPEHTSHRMYSAQWQQPEGLTPIIIRFFDGTRCEEDARTEANALRDLSRAGYPVPEFYHLVEDRTLTGASFIVMQCLPGLPLGTLVLAHPETISAWLDKASNLLLKLHGLKWQNGFDTFQPALEPLEFAERQIKWWSRQAQVVSANETSDGFRWLRGNLYRARRAKDVVLVHRDFRPNKLLAENDKIAGVVDWDELTIADPAVDVAWTRMYLSTEVNADLGNLFTEAYSRRNPEVMETLAFWEVFAACKRMTIIAQKQHGSLPNDALGNSGSDRLPAEAPQTLIDFLSQRLSDDD